MQRRQEALAGLHQDDARAARVGDPEVARDDVHRELLDRAGELDPRRAAADNDERQLRGARVRIRFGLRTLEGSQQPRADEGRLLHVLHTRCEGTPVLMAEVVVDRPGCQHQVVVGHRETRGCQAVVRKIDAGHLGQHDARVGLGAQDGAHRLGDVRRGERGGGDLVKQWLEQVVVVAVDDQHLGRRAAQRLGSKEPAEAAADNNDPHLIRALQGLPLRFRQTPELGMITR